jgi:ATP-binding cassette subfamily B protein
MACEKAGIRAGYIRRKTLNTYIYKTKKYMIAQILWDLSGFFTIASTMAV